MSHSGKGENTFCIVGDFGVIIVMLWILYKNPAGHMHRYVSTVVFLTMFFIITFRVAAAVQKYVCHPPLCNILEGISIILYVLSRGFISLFYVDKARASQGLDPVFPERYFTKLFPSIIILGMFIGVIGLVVMWGFSDISWKCEHLQSHIFSFDSCTAKELYEENTKSSLYVLVIVVIVELGTTLAFMYLYLKPLRHVWNHRGIEKQRRLKQLILFNVGLTLLGTISSNITEIYFFTGYGTWHFLRFDAVINVYTLYLMVRKNRSGTRHWKLVCITKQKENVEKKSKTKHLERRDRKDLTITPSVIDTNVNITSSVSDPESKPPPVIEVSSN